MRAIWHIHEKLLFSLENLTVSQRKIFIGIFSLFANSQTNTVKYQPAIYIFKMSSKDGIIRMPSKIKA